MISQSTGIRLLDGRFDVLRLPFLDVEIGCDRLIQKIRAVPVKGLGQDIQRIYLVGLKPETDRLFFHIAMYYTIIHSNGAQDN
jgi:hypothetical protein